MWNQDSFIGRALPWIAGAALLLWMAQLIPSALDRALPVLLSAVVVAAATAPAARALERYRIPRGITVLAIYLVVALLFAGIAALMLPVVADEIELAHDSVPRYGRQIQTLIDRIAPSQTGQTSADRITEEAVSRVGGLLEGAASLALSAGSALVQVALVLVMAYFMVVEADFAGRVVTRFTPPAHRARMHRLLGVMGGRLGQWARAQALLALLFGVSFGIGLWAIGVRHAWTLALVGGVLEIVPYLGGAVTMVLAVLVAGAQSPWLVLWTLLVYIAIVQIEAHVVAPALIGRAVGLHPLVVVIALFLGAELLGVLGALLAVPLAIVIQVLLDEFYAPDSRTVWPEAAVDAAAHPDGAAPLDTSAPS